MMTALWAIVLTIAASPSQGGQTDYEIRKNVDVVMSDGIHLATDLYLPKPKGKHPTILVRDAYNKDNKGFIGQFFASNGYAAVIQDVRGKFGSEGAFFPMAFEKQDGLATLDWIVQQPWSNGEIGYWGISYLAHCGMMLAPEDRPALKTVINIAGISDSYQTIYPDGSFNLLGTTAWLMMCDCQRQRSIRDIDFTKLFSSVPLVKLTENVPQYQGQSWNTLTRHLTYDHFYQNLSMNHLYDKIKIPILHIAGWNDWIYPQVLQTYKGISKTNTRQKIIIGAWTHNQEINGGTKFGDEDFGPKSEMGRDQLMTLSLKWFDHYLKGKQNRIPQMPRVKYFLMGKNTWMTSQQFPPASAKQQVWFLESRGEANSLRGEGKLTRTRSANIQNKLDKFVYDPQKPVPTVGGINSHLYRQYNGIYDQNSVEKRKDVLVYTSAPFEKEITIVGDILLKLYASSDAVDTDFTAKLVEVRPNGYARIIEDGLIKTRFRNALTSPAKIVRGKVYPFTLKLGTTAISIPKGNRIRLEISSSNFPKYPKNPNTGVDELNATHFIKATQKIYHSFQYPSQLILSVLPSPAPTH